MLKNILKILLISILAISVVSFAENVSATDYKINIQGQSLNNIDLDSAITLNEPSTDKVKTIKDKLRIGLKLVSEGKLTDNGNSVVIESLINKDIWEPPENVGLTSYKEIKNRLNYFELKKHLRSFSLPFIPINADDKGIKVKTQNADYYNLKVDNEVYATGSVRNSRPINPTNPFKIKIDADWRAVATFTITDISTGELIWEKDVAGSDSHEITISPDHFLHQISINCFQKGSIFNPSNSIFINIFDQSDIDLYAYLDAGGWQYRAGIDYTIGIYNGTSGKDGKPGAVLLP